MSGPEGDAEHGEERMTIVIAGVIGMVALAGMLVLVERIAGYEVTG